jgi:hypothetical protein
METKQVRTKNRILYLLVLVVVSIPLPGQDNPRSLNVKFITEEIQIDGILDEAIWNQAEVATDLWQFFPPGPTLAQQQTEFRMLYNEHTLYVGIRAESVGGKYAVTSLRRDFGGASNDNVTLMFDTFRDGTNAFLFGVTPYGVQREALLSGGGSGREAFNYTWDIRWRTESKMYEDHYVVEIAIPFTSLKFEEGATHWRFQGYRWDMQTNVQSALARVPQNQMLSSLAFMGDLYFEKPLGRSRTPISIIPYINALADKDYVADETNARLRVGGDVKIAISNGMNLDLTVNPDFSNVEVDDIFTNLTRFEQFLPEKRQFFIDNSDLFQSFGSVFRDAYPFFSRRIGLARDTSGNLIENRILGGVRLSGKINENWRLGFLNIQTDENPGNEIPSNNNMMLAVERKVFSRSNIGLFMINRQSVKDYEFIESSEKYNRLVGMDYNLASEDNTWTGKFYLHKSFQPDDNKGNLSSQATVTYNRRHFQYTTDWVYVDRDFTSDLGYVPRKGIFKAGNRFLFRLYPKKGSVSSHTFGPMTMIFYDPYNNFKKTDHTLNFSWQIAFKNQSITEAQFSNQYIFLTRDFDPTRTPGAVPLPGNQGYTFNQVSLSYRSNPATLFSFNAETTVGQFFNGQLYSAGGEMSMRFQPWVNLSLALNYDGIRLPEPHADADLWLVTPRIDITFTKSLFWSTLVQYSNQRDNLGINSRLQWRFAPLSDLYLVYNDNYITSDFGPRFRSINLKVTYWLNL